MAQRLHKSVFRKVGLGGEMRSIARYCTLEHVESLVSESVWEEYHSREIDDARREATALSVGAYQYQSRTQFDLAERILHIINIKTDYSAPLHPILNAIWITLMRAKQIQMIDEVPDEGPTVPEKAIKILKDLVDENEREDIRVLEMVTTSKDLGVLAYYTKNWFTAIGGFDHQLINLFLHSKKHIIQKSIAHNLTDEFCEDQPHYEVRLQWCRSIGVDFSRIDRVRDENIITEAFSIQSFRTGLALQPNPNYCLGMFYSIEALHPRVCAMFCRNLRARGFDEKTLEYWSGHGELDLEHADEWLEALVLAKLSDEDWGQIVTGARRQFANRRKFFVAIESELERRNNELVRQDINEEFAEDKFESTAA